MLRKLLVGSFVSLVALAIALPAGAVIPSADHDDRVSGVGVTYYRYDGGTDAAITECNDLSTSPTPVAPTATDIDPNDGGARHQQNEPPAAVDPTDPNTVISGANDYCATDLDVGLMGFNYSRDAGESWRASLIPGYPFDTSAGGQSSPLQAQGLTDFSDPIAAFDNAGNLFFGGISYAGNLAPQGGHNAVFVAKYNTTPPSCAATTCPGFPVSYDHTSIVAKGASSKNLFGAFHDKPMLEVDRTGGPTDGNVYVCWTKFNGNASPSDIMFSASTDHGATYSKPFKISSTPFSPSVQGCDIAIEHDGEIWVEWRTINTSSRKSTYGIAYSRSTNVGKSWTASKLAVNLGQFGIYFPFDGGARDCGDGAFECPSHFVFNRYPLEPRITADQSGQLPGVYIMYNAVDPATVVTNTQTSYSSAGVGTGRVGQSKSYVAKYNAGTDSWLQNQVEPNQSVGHAFFPDGDALNGKLVVVWQDSRADPAYSVFLPPGNTPGATSSGTQIMNAFYSVSTDGIHFSEPVQVSSVGNQSDWEMFGNRQVPFYGDYNWVSLAESGDGLFAYMAWTDGRDVVSGNDPRETTQDGFDVHQCRTAQPGGTFSADTCPNAGGLDQNIYGNSANI
jgi:hypothetical protein